MSKFPPAIGTYVRIQDCADIALECLVQGFSSENPVYQTARDEAFKYGEWCFDEALLERHVESTFGEYGQDF
jgi:hypothetical protein